MTGVHHQESVQIRSVMIKKRMISAFSQFLSEMCLLFMPRIVSTALGRVFKTGLNCTDRFDRNRRWNKGVSLASVKCIHSFYRTTTYDHSISNDERSILKVDICTYLTHNHAIGWDVSNKIGMCQNRSLWWSCRQERRYCIKVDTHQGTSCGDMKRGYFGLQRQLSSCDMPVLGKKFCCGDKILFHEIQLVWIRTSWSRMTSVFSVASCALLLQTVPTST